MKKIKLKVKKLVGEKDKAIAILHNLKMKEISAQEGDILFVENKNWWYGGLKSCKVRCGRGLEEKENVEFIYLSDEKIKEGTFKEGEIVKVEKIL
jgi:hypothetical protein